MEASKKSSTVSRWLAAASKPVKRTRKQMCTAIDSLAECAFKKPMADMTARTNAVQADYRLSRAATQFTFRSMEDTRAMPM
jgi:hypothetical protein